MEKRLIEVAFPVKRVSEESVREKNIRHGHISTLHIWWARRPLAASRATAYAALVPAPKNAKELLEKMEFTAKLSKWENSLNANLIERAKREILEAHGGRPPRVLDPFAGGGSIPLEALRLGCETYAGEYNPVAVLILKCTLEYPQKYGRARHVKKVGPLNVVTPNPLLEDVKRWGSWVLEEAKKEIGKFYPPDPDGSIPVAYIWARTIPCQNPSCRAEIPLMRQFWLARKENRKIALRPYVKGKKVEFEVVGQGKKFPAGFDPSKGTVKGAVATCLVCGSTVDDDTVRKLFQEGKAGQRMVAVVLHHPKKRGKFYRVATENDLKIYRSAEKYLEKKRAKLMEEWGTDPVPDEPILKTPSDTMGGTNRILNYGMTKWGDLFNARQKLALVTFVEKVKKVYEKVIKENGEKECAKAIVNYLGFVISRASDFMSNLCRWHPQWEFIPNTFARQALPMAWDYSELNLFSPVLTGTFESMLRQIYRVLDEVSKTNSTTQSIIAQFSATSMPYPDNYFDAVFTDPPYYDNIPYSYLSDFFYVWLKRTIGDLYPDLFLWPLTPKEKEIVAYTHDKTWEEAKGFFESNLKKAFQEIYRVLKPGGIAIIVYTHKSTEGWETLINSLLDSGLVVTASWPIHTEMKERLVARETAALASSIYLVARKIEREEVGWYNEVKEEMRKRIFEKLDRLWDEGIRGADFFISAIGSAIEVFGKYKKVMDHAGNEIDTKKLLEDVRSFVVDYTIRQILENGIIAELSPLTKFYILWRWTYQTKKAHFDDAKKLAQAVGIDLPSEWNRGFIRKEKEYIRVLGPHERDPKELEEATDLIDVLHLALILWKEGRKSEMKRVLLESGWGSKEYFYKVAQAIAGALEQVRESQERRWLQGFLSKGREIIIDLKQKVPVQRRLFE